jgi:hypothetical protein
VASDGPIAPIPPGDLPSPVRGNVMLAAADVELGHWLAAFAPIPGLVAGNQDLLADELTRALGINAALNAAAAARSTFVPGLGLDGLAPIINGPAPAITTGAGAPAHPGNGGNIWPAASLGSDANAYATQTQNEVNADLAVAPIV